MDYGKMKVIELRAELQARGLDTKGRLFVFPSAETINFILKTTGVKAALIDRLKEALDLEQQQAGKFQALKVLIGMVF